MLQPLGSQSDTTERLNCTELHVGRPLGFAPEAALKDLGLPLDGQVWRWCSCLSHRGSGSTRYSEELGAQAAGNIVL